MKDFREMAKGAYTWIDALPYYKKTTGKLCNGKGRYCCLGVGAKVLNTGDSLESGLTAPMLGELVGLHDDCGAFAYDTRTHNACALSEINDDTYKKDKGFKNVRRFIITHLDLVFIPEVAKRLKRKYAKQIKNLANS